MLLRRLRVCLGNTRGGVEEPGAPRGCAWPRPCCCPAHHHPASAPGSVARGNWGSSDLGAETLWWRKAGEPWGRVRVPGLWAKEGRVETPARVPLTLEMEARLRLPLWGPHPPAVHFSGVLSAQFTVPGVWNVDPGP